MRVRGEPGAHEQFEGVLVPGQGVGSAPLGAAKERDQAGMAEQVHPEQACRPCRLAGPVQAGGWRRAGHADCPVGEQGHEFLAVADVIVERGLPAAQRAGDAAHGQRGRSVGIEQGHGRVEDGLERQQPVPPLERRGVLPGEPPCRRSRSRTGLRVAGRRRKAGGGCRRFGHQASLVGVRTSAAWVKLTSFG